MDGGAWQATVSGVGKSQTGLGDQHFDFHFHVPACGDLAWLQGYKGGLPTLQLQRLNTGPTSSMSWGQSLSDTDDGGISCPTCQPSIWFGGRTKLFWYDQSDTDPGSWPFPINRTWLEARDYSRLWMKHKLEWKLLGEISITSDTQMIPPLW